MGTKGLGRKASKETLELLADGSLWGTKGLAKVGSKTVKSFAKVMYGVDILLGSLDIAEGVKEINGSEAAEQYRLFGKEYSKATKTLEEELETVVEIFDFLKKNR